MGAPHEGGTHREDPAPPSCAPVSNTNDLNYYMIHLIMKDTKPNISFNSKIKLRNLKSRCICDAVLRKDAFSLKEI